MAQLPLYRGQNKDGRPQSCVIIAALARDRSRAVINFCISLFVMWGDWEHRINGHGLWKYIIMKKITLELLSYLMISLPPFWIMSCDTWRRIRNINSQRIFQANMFEQRSHHCAHRCSSTWRRWGIRRNSHYTDVTMSIMASQISGIWTVCSDVCSGAHQRKHQSSTSPAFVRGIHRWRVNSPHKGPVTRKMFPFDDVIMVLTGIHSDLVSILDRQLTCWYVEFSIHKNKPKTPRIHEIIRKSSAWG